MHAKNQDEKVKEIVHISDQQAQSHNTGESAEPGKSILPILPIEIDQEADRLLELEYSTNWAGNIVYSSATPIFPESVEALRKIVLENEYVKILGTRHSFNKIGDTEHTHAALIKMNRVIDIDPTQLSVTVEGGITYGTLGNHLSRAGYALPNLASLPHISVAGACATATHGSGLLNGNLATAVSAIEIMKADGELVTLHRNDGGPFYGAVVGLGALGVVTKLTLDIEPYYLVRQDVYEHLPLEEVYDHFDAIQSSAYSVSFFTDWQGPINQVWLKRRVSADANYPAPLEFFGARRAREKLHPIKGNNPKSCTPQLGRPGPWNNRLPHFKFDQIPSNGTELQSEYFVPIEYAIEAIQKIHEIKDRFPGVLLISEIRTINSDSFWMSPCYEQPCVGIHFTWKKDESRVNLAIEEIEHALEGVDARPHWGKKFLMEPDKILTRYPRINDFQKLLGEFDPKGKFQNQFLKKYFL